MDFGARLHSSLWFARFWSLCWKIVMRYVHSDPYAGEDITCRLWFVDDGWWSEVRCCVDWRMKRIELKWWFFGKGEEWKKLVQKWREEEGNGSKVEFRWSWRRIEGCLLKKRRMLMEIAMEFGVCYGGWGKKKKIEVLFVSRKSGVEMKKLKVFFWVSILSFVKN